jgi:hypothetical protein
MFQFLVWPPCHTKKPIIIPCGLSFTVQQVLTAILMRCDKWLTVCFLFDFKIFTEGYLIEQTDNHW